MRKQVHKKEIKLPLDTRNRVCLTQFLPKGVSVSSFKAHQEGNNIVLVPLVEIPASEHWIYTNPEVMTKLQQGLSDIKKGKVKSLGSFAKYATED